MSKDAETHRLFWLEVIRWARYVRKLRAAAERFDRILHHREYECVGGPLDGKSVVPDPAGVTMYAGRGYYEKGPDLRLHYHELAKSWFDKAQNGGNN